MHPGAGGAERFTEEIGRRLVTFGHEVTIFTSNFDGGEPEESRLGMRIIRRGGKYSVYSKARSYVKHHLSDYEILIDEINTIPFRIGKVAKTKPVLAVIHQLARQIWFYETRFPLSVLGYVAIEPLLLREYRHTPTVTVSESTKGDLLHLGFRRVSIVHNGINVQPLSQPPEKESHPVLIFVGRLVRSKLPSHAIEAFEQLRMVLSDAELWIVGDGYLRSELEKANGDGIRFFGRVGDEEKNDLLKRAHVLLVPSIREGWGISVIEANAVGTPAVGYAVPGLTDSIVNGSTGFLVQRKHPQDLARAAYQVLSNPVLWQKLSTNAVEWSKKFSWDTAAKEFQRVLNSVCKTESPLVSMVN